MNQLTYVNNRKPTTSEHRFEMNTDPLTNNEVIFVGFWSFDQITQSSRLNYSNQIRNYDKELRIVKYTTIDTLINFNYTLAKPIKVKIIKDMSGVVGDIEELELYSFGEDEFEVLRELNEELVTLFEDLIETDNCNLGKFPKKWKSILKKYIKNGR